MKNYSSPFYIISDDDSLSNLKMVKRKMLAEIELSDVGACEVGSVSYTRNEIEQLFEGLANSDILEYHRYIFKTKWLLNFLERGDVPNFLSFTDEDERILNKKDFVAFISPYYSERYGEVLCNLLKNRRYVTQQRFNNLPFLVAEIDYEKCYQPAWSFLNNYINDIRSLKASIAKSGYNTELNKFINYELADCINQLPDYFRAEKSEYLRQLLKITDILVEKQLLEQLRRTVRFCIIIDDNHERIKALEDWYKQINSAVERNEGRSSEGGGMGFIRVLGFLVAIIVVILKIANHSGNSNSSNRNSRLKSKDYSSVLAIPAPNMPYYKKIETINFFTKGLNHKYFYTNDSSEKECFLIKLQAKNLYVEKELNRYPYNSISNISVFTVINDSLFKAKKHQSGIWFNNKSKYDYIIFITKHNTILSHVAVKNGERFFLHFSPTKRHATTVDLKMDIYIYPGRQWYTTFFGLQPLNFDGVQNTNSNFEFANKWVNNKTIWAKENYVFELSDSTTNTVKYTFKEL